MKKKLFNDGWKYTKKPLYQDFSVNEFKIIQEWERVDIPHDWLISDAYNFYEDSEGWYQKEFFVSQDELELRALIHFDGIYLSSELYVNGKFVGNWAYGYTAFHFDISSFLNKGKNIINVRVQHKVPNSRWYSGAGIYRNVWLEQTKQSYILPNGVYISSKHEEKLRWSVTIHTELFLTQKATLIHEIYEKDHKLICCLQEEMDASLTKHEGVLVVNDPKLWDTDSPNLYKVKTKIIINEEIVQEITHSIGFRDIKLTPDRGITINCKELKIFGVCLHHDLGALGSAFSISAQRRQLEMLKKMGVNAIRTAHNPAANEFYDLADEMGFLIQSEFTDVWKHGKNKYDYASSFEEWYEKDIESWIKRERNHSSIFMWSIGNEIYDTHGREDGRETTKQLRDLTRSYDYLRNAVITFGSNYLQWEGSQQSADELEAVGYNYGEILYKKHHEEKPNWVIYGSETCSVVQSRGIYHFPLSKSILSDDDFQCSALGNSTTSWGAKSVEDCIIKDRDCPFSLGQFIWSGIDYIGEPTPYGTKNSYLGQLDTAVLPKDAFYVFQAAWVPVEKKPMIHIFPYWDFSIGQEIDVRVCSNTPIIELFFNGKTLGKRSIDVQHGNHLIEDWSIIYQPGELVAKGYDINGNVLCEDRTASFDDSYRIVMKPSKFTCDADGQDIVFLEISTVDKTGEDVANACDRIQLTIDGPARLIGMDNGDSTDYDSYKTNHKRLFSGKLVAFIAPTFESGTIKITATSPELISAETKLISHKVKIDEGSSDALTIIEEKQAPKENNIRKIELKTLSTPNNQLDNSTIIVEAVTFPKSARKQELIWRVTDEQGIDSRIADYTIEDQRITIKAKANGKIYIRCGVKNGKNHLDRYSTLDFEVTHLDEALLNPYETISGGLYTRSNVELTNGNERGIATLRGTESWVTFDEIDFGYFGSDILTLSLFPLEEKPFLIEIWKGIPYEVGSYLIDTILYSLGSIWNTYQEQSYKLKSRISGITSLTFVFLQKVHMKEFSFKRINRAQTELLVIENDLIYGDHFQINENKIEHIGNNVTIQFRDLDFSEDGIKGVKINGRSRTQRNSIKIQFINEVETLVRLVEFPETADYQDQIFSFESLMGCYIVEFIFLPGSNFDFLSFEFLPTINE